VERIAVDTETGLKAMRPGGESTRVEVQMNRKDILSYTFQEYAAMVEKFHGYSAPGVIIGGFMVDLAYRSLSGKALYNVICETAKCLPDAVQLLTPCSIGNRWLKIINVGRYALTFYDKHNGPGVRVYIDTRKMEQWSGIRDWYLKLKPKHAQDEELLLSQIRAAGSGLCSTEEVVVNMELLREKHGPIAVCPSCEEAYPAADGAVCLACRGGLLPYASRLPYRNKISSAV
jgi:formylmethanofuran dehydrogenase subunit E